MSTGKDAPYKVTQHQMRMKSRTVTLLQPTLPERISRLNPHERGELRRIINSLKLRKIIRRTLAEAFYLGEVQKQEAQMNSMLRLRTAVRTHESLKNYERALTGSGDTTVFDPFVTRSGDLTLIATPGA